MTTTRKGSEQSGGTSPLDFLRRRPVDHQFVEEDRKRMDDLSASVKAMTESINSLSLDLFAYMNEWRQHR